MHVLVRRNMLIQTPVFPYCTQVKTGAAFSTRFIDATAPDLCNDSCVIFSCPTHFSIGHVIPQQVEHHIDLMNSLKNTPPCFVLYLKAPLKGE